ncbi:uncharacterized protein K02A2.6-like [Musca domestica]|uniref:RNA-directed DNA polymerase n=1 Tax=Musca domestica TaxID=7370 RepID=A0ABM3VNN1_MUSDO|nr:uncharacterized protein K02A2.6-like [Musca domestica]
METQSCGIFGSDHQFKAYAGKAALTIKVIEHGEQSLLGKDTAIKLGVLKLGIGINHVEKLQPFNKIAGIKVNLSIDTTVRPIQQPLRRVPVAVEDRVEAKLNEALALDIIEPVIGPSAWISPVVVVFKENGDIRLCIDMRRANTAILRENYPLPTFDSFMTRLQGAKFFSRLDLKNAYHQLELEEESRYITTFITSKGLFRYKRLLFGVNSAPEIFQRTMESILAPCKNALNYLDDIIVFGATAKEHDEYLQDVLNTFKNFNVAINEDKCLWKVQNLKFLGHVLSTNGISADPDKIDSVLNFRAPNSREETRRFLGLVTYLGKFIPDLSDLVEPLREITKANEKFIWTTRQNDAFLKLKEKLIALPTLTYFSPKRRTRLIADASPVALGAVLIQFTGDTPYVVSFASKALSEVERRYSQTEKESLALVWAVERFYYYLAGIQIELETDHKPLEAIFKPTSKPPARIERWVLRLQSFSLKIIYKAGKHNIADSLSRLCNLDTAVTFDKPCEFSICSIIENSVPQALTILEIVHNNSKDDEILQAVECVNTEDWSTATKNRYYPFRFELSILGNLLLRGTRLVIPASLRQRVLDLGHEGHPGETVMKRRIRSKIWWPLVDRDIEKYVKSCYECMLVSRPIPPAPMKRRIMPDSPWACVAMDLLGPLPNHDFVFVVIDYYSRYHELKFMKKITSTEIIDFLEEIFARHGYPKSITADNGPQFVSEEFKTFCSTNNIDLMTSPPYWPQANGEVENLNRSLLKRLQIAHSQGLDYKKEIHKIPSLNDVEENVIDSEARDNDIVNKDKGKQRADSDRNAVDCNIRVGDKVLMRNTVHSNKLSTTFGQTEYEVTERKGNDVVISGEGRVYRRNITHVKKIPTDSSLPSLARPTETSVADPEHHELHHDPDAADEGPLTNESSSEPSSKSSNLDTGGSRPKVTMKLKKNRGGMWQPAE